MGSIIYLNLSRVVEPSIRINKTENRVRVPCKGKVVGFIINFPSGTDNLLGVFCGVRQNHLVPVDGEVRMSETTIFFPTDFVVERDDYVWAGMVNYSSVNAYRAEVYACVECEDCYESVR